MDCLWGFLCEGNVRLFHSRLQDDFHRTGGWGQFAGLRRHGNIVMSFELFASHYGPGVDADGTPWAGAAYADLRSTLQANGYHPLRGTRSLLLPHTSGAWTAEIQRSGSVDLVVMGVWTG